MGSEAMQISPARRKALLGLSDQWEAGPSLPAFVIDHILWLRETGLVERQFGDMSKEVKASRYGIKASISACWWFRLSERGLAIVKDTPDADT